ncbi:hypothetical protein Geob_1540 [Geotalea daltonii FRC-32]|uniref:Uncharacterized protein n=1 Tax=Geotalea daltonii (strain DSM 22248 / JCM 15807 / FRC-32) TaxID=316067 RepID=B9M5E4_GEODF|nr:hypothetical protein [Geotalea daltonii]ACM19899.1 hypothetical protein Geob_1540 [Geotalea daltonii FRC-32]
MRITISAIAVFLIILSSVTASVAEGEDANAEAGTIFTLWPLLDYRDSPKDGFRNISMLGPFFKFQHNKEDHDTAVRPLFYQTTNRHNGTSSADYLYPLASRDVSPEVATFQFLKLVQSNSYRKDEPEQQEKDAMFFPFYISGKSEKYGPYTSVFPFYGDIYERFWRDEYHYVLFPLYGRTAKKGTTTRNYLYPFFSTVEGEGEKGFQFWPLYGQASKEGAYCKRFALWPIFSAESSRLNTDNPTHKVALLPFYAATNSPQKVSRSYLWPFFGYTDDIARDQHEIDYFWPFWLTVRGSTRNVTSVLPFYSVDRGRESLKRWYMWPLLKREEISSSSYSQHLDRVLFFLYTDSRETWAKDGSERQRTALWPLFVYKKDTRGVMSLSVPAPVEPIFDRDGIEKNWAPLWRIYQQRWNETGDSAVSFIWNLYWHEVRNESLAYELFPFIQFQSDSKMSDLKLLKGLIRYRSSNGTKNLSLLWLPFGFNWGSTAADVEAEASAIPRSTQ